MSRQNAYDHPRFHAAYQQFRANQRGLNETVEQPAMRSLIPDPAGLDVIDLGCGTGDMSVELAQQGARVLAVDPSQRMLAQAEAHPRVTYVRSFAEDLALDPSSTDLIVSSLALHYIANLGELITRIASWLRPGGRFVASMEHPVATATRGWCDADHGHRRIDRYFDVGPRSTGWFIDGVVKHHRTSAEIVSAILGADLTLNALLEPTPTATALRSNPHLAHAAATPALLVVAAHRPADPP